MPRNLWPQDGGKSLVCVDSYDGGVMKGRIVSAFHETECFDSLSGFLVRMDAMLDENRMPQSSITQRTFSDFLQPMISRPPVSRCSRGQQATFELQVLFRRNASWQGRLLWKEKNREQTFRSVLEMVFLMDSALRSMERSDVV